MNRVVHAVGRAFLYLCVATVIAQVAGIGTLWFKGALDRPRLYRVLAALHGIDILAMHAQRLARQETPQPQQPVLAQREAADGRKSLDIDLREMAVNKGLLDMQNLQTALRTERARFQDLKQAYDTRLQQLLEEEQLAARREVQRTLEAIQPAQAKQQILKMIDDDAMDDVVAIIKSMPIDKRKKIIAEFKQRDDERVLFDILKNMRMGEPAVTQIEEARNRLAEIGSAP